MYSRYQLARKYIHYYINAANGRGHGIHSPFVYDFVRNVLMGEGDAAAYKPIEALRKQLGRDRTLVEIEDFGAGGGQRMIYRRSISDLAKHVAKPPKLGRLLYRIARHYQPARILELGSSLGLSTAYLAAGAGAGWEAASSVATGMGVNEACPVVQPPKVVTIEGAGAVAEVARRNFRQLGPELITAPVELVGGNFDQVLPEVLSRISPVDLAFIDGNHRMEPTLRYFDQLSRHASDSSVLIFDDIHWSREMEEAWGHIREDGRSCLTIDLFFFGLVFRRKEFKVKQHFTIRF